VRRPLVKLAPAMIGVDTGSTFTDLIAFVNGEAS
jgi:N-methylhydantoinase A/oxoprolinase/acetone carboxylase beta subunit